MWGDSGAPADRSIYIAFMLQAWAREHTQKDRDTPLQCNLENHIPQAKTWAVYK